MQGNEFNSPVDGISAEPGAGGGNRRAGTADKCLTLRHITEPRKLCVAY